MEGRNKRCPSDPADKLARKDGICKQEKPGARSVLKLWMEGPLRRVAYNSLQSALRQVSGERTSPRQIASRGRNPILHWVPTPAFAGATFFVGEK